MDYIIAYLLRGDVGQAHRRQVHVIAKRFDEHRLHEKILPSHVTLKYRFTTERIDDVESALEHFIEKRRKARLKIRDYFSFDDHVICYKVDFSASALRTYAGLVRELKKIPWLPWRREDSLQGKFHCTLVYPSSKDSYERITHYLAARKPHFDLEFDHIAILRRPKKRWIVHKTYSLR